MLVCRPAPGRCGWSFTTSEGETFRGAQCVAWENSEASEVLGLGLTLSLVNLMLVITRLMLFTFLHGFKFMGDQERGRLQLRGTSLGGVP